MIYGMLAKCIITNKACVKKYVNIEFIINNFI